MNTLMDFFRADTSPLNNSIQKEIGNLNDQIQSWAEKGTHRKSYIKKLLTEEKNRIRQTYKKALEREAERWQVKATEAKEKYADEIKRNPGFYLHLQEQKKFQASLLTDDELKAKLSQFLTAGADTADPGEKLFSKVAIWETYEDLQATFTEARSREGLKTLFAEAAKTLKTANISPYQVAYKEAIPYADQAAHYAAESGEKILISVDRAGKKEEIQVPLEKLIDETPLTVLQD